jgi:putative addiction module component (TIGR02574 family)
MTPDRVYRRLAIRSRDAGTLYDRTVKRKAVDILKEALALPSEERAALAASLLDGLDTGVDEDAEAAWAIEVDRRVTELDGGAVKTIAWAEVRRRLAAH